MSEYRYLSHFGIKGMHWGERRYQNEDGSLTAEGRYRYAKGTITPTGIAKSIGSAAKKAKDRASLELFKAEVLYGRPALRRAKQAKRFGTALAKAKGEHYGKQISSKVRDASITYSNLMRRMSAQGREATRLRAYVASDRYAQTKRKALASIKNAERYRERVESAKRFIEEKQRVGRLAAEYSHARYQARTGNPVIREGGNGIFGGRYLSSAPKVDMTDRYRQEYEFSRDNAKFYKRRSGQSGRFV